MSLFGVFDIAGSAMSAQGLRMNTTASNLANAESVSSSLNETYRARQVTFAAVRDDVAFGDMSSWGNDLSANAGVKVTGIVESQAPLVKRFQPEHAFADEEGYVSYPNVNIVEEMANMISASRSFQTNVELMNSAKRMMQQTLSLGQ